jgi:uncharacterized protein YbaR (Trm112 family)
LSVDRHLAAHAHRADGTRQPLQSFAGQACAAVAGIAQPQAFFDMLGDAGISLAHAIALPDHADFNVPMPAQVGADMPLFCTEKDAVKLWRTHPLAWAVPLDVSIEPPFWSCLDALLERSYHRPMDPKLLELLVCPVTKGHLDLDRTRQELVSRSARLAYPIRDGIPVLLEEEARTLSDEELERLPARTPLV